MEGSAIDAQFHRAVDIVQGLTKGGPVQTSYDEKLWLYSLYKQATEGDISVSRPGILDILGRAKWWVELPDRADFRDYWNKQKGKRKDSAKQEYISALLKILKKHSDRPACASHIAELEPHTSKAPRHTRARSTSSSSSSSSYHSSQASPPPSPPRYSSYPPPDPSLPVPDVAPNIVYPASLHPSHKSLTSLAQARSPPPEPEHMPGGSEAGNSRSARGYGRGVLPYTVTSGSRAHSLAGGHAGSVDTYAYGGRNNSIHSLRQAPRGGSAASLGFIPQNAGPSEYPITPQVIQRDFTPALTQSGTPYLDIHHPTPTYPSNPHRRIGTPSTYSAPPINVPATLQQIQTSLSAINERMNHLERSQAMILRRDERRRAWFWSSKDEDEMDEAEEEAERERLRRPGESGGREVRTAVGTRVRRRWSLRLVWWLLGLSRRLMVDAGVGLMVALAAMLLVRGWRGEVGRRLRMRLRELLQAA